MGIVCIGFAMILTLLYSDQLTAKNVISGFGTSLFIQMVGVTYLFAIIHSNGTLELLAKKVVSLVPARAIPVVMFFLGMVLSAAGPGSIPCLAIIPVIAIPLSLSAGINPIMTSIIGDMGAMAGRMSPLTPEAAVVRSLMEEQGINGDTVPIMICTFITAIVVSILIFVYLLQRLEGRHRCKRPQGSPARFSLAAAGLAGRAGCFGRGRAVPQVECRPYRFSGGHRSDHFRLRR